MSLSAAVKMRDEGTVRNKALYLAIGVTPEGRKDVVGIWMLTRVQVDVVPAH